MISNNKATYCEEEKKKHNKSPRDIFMCRTEHLNFDIRTTR